MKKAAPEFWQQATRQLARKDPTLGKIIKSYKGEALTSRGALFYTLARSITGQQISVKAANSVWQKMEAGLGPIKPEAILAANEELLRSFGLSWQKVSYLRHIAEHCDKNKAALKRWKTMEDEALIKELTIMKGVGRWTAEMMLIFHFLRPDVFPLDDLGVLKAVSIHYNNRKPITRPQALKIAEQWKPWRTVATWYLWRSLDPHPVEY